MSSTEVVSNVNVIESEDRKLKFSEKVATVINGTMGSFHSQVIQMFLLFFYTDIMKISPAFVAPLFLVARVTDAFLAPAFGIFIDKRTTRFGKYKPWAIVIGALTGVFGWLTFTSFGLSSGGKLVYATITYFLYSTLKTIEIAPQAALVPAVVKRIDDRMSMNQIGYFLMMIAIMFAQIGVQPLYKKLGGGNGAKGFSILMGIVAVVGILVAVFQSVTLKERYVVKEDKKDENKLSLKEMIVTVFTNKTALIAYTYIFAINLSNGIRSTATIYYLKYYFHNEGLMVTIGAISILPVMVGVALSKIITKRIGIRMNLIIGSIANVVTLAAVIFVPGNKAGITMFMVLLVAMSFFNGLCTPASGTLLPAAMDYTEWKSGKSINAFMGSFQGFLQTFATAISGTLVAGGLAVVGYVGGAAEQSSSTLMGLKILMSVLPAVVISLTFVVAKFDLTEEKQAQITKELAERRKNAQASATV